MSAIAGLLWRVGQPAHPAQMQHALERLAPFGPDGCVAWAEGPLALGHAALHNSAEARFEQWPLAHPSGLRLVADARLDNRADLLATLHPAPPAARPVTDAELIVAAHLRWGDAAPARLIGDFAYALWDERDHALRLVRSPSALKGLYYHLSAERLAFASSLRALLPLVPEARTLNRPWAAAFLRFEGSYLWEQSAVEGVLKLPPAHLLRLPLGGVPSQRRFWALEWSDEYEGWSEARWQQALRHAFVEAVRAQLRSPGALAGALSGGLDSSSVALVAHELMQRDSGVAPQPVALHTYRMAEWPETDESAFRAAALARLPHFEAAWVERPHAWTWGEVERWGTLSSQPAALGNAFGFLAGLDFARSRERRVMLSGTGGDLLTGSEDYAFLESLFSLPWSERLAELPHFARGYSRGLGGLLREWLREQLPAPLQRWHAQRRVALATPQAEALSPPLPHALHAPAGAAPRQRLVWQALARPEVLFPFESNGELAAAHGIEYRTPFADQRLVTLCFHQPEQLRIRRGQTRYLFKQALADLLPPALIQRNSKILFSRYVGFSVRAEDHARAAALPSSARLRQEGWINEAQWEAWAAPNAHPMQRALLHRAAHFEQWLGVLGL